MKLRALALAFVLMTTPSYAQDGAPVAPRHSHIVERHGQKVDDPYFWLRERENPQVLDYLKAENRYTEALCAPQVKLRETLYTEMIGRIPKHDQSVPQPFGDFAYYTRIEEGQQYPVYCRTPRGGGPEQVLLDGNEMAKGHAYFKITGAAISPDGRRLAYLTDTVGFRQYHLAVKNLQTGEQYPLQAERVTSVTWAGDSQTLFFTTEDEVTKRSDRAFRADLEGHSTPIYHEVDELYSIDVYRTRDGQWVILEAESTDSWESRVVRSDHPEEDFRVVLPRQRDHKYRLDSRGNEFFIRTNREATDFRLVRCPSDHPDRWTEVLPAQDGVFREGFQVFQDFLVVQEKVEGLQRFRVLQFAENRWHEVEFPEVPYTADLDVTREANSKTFRFTFESMVTPPTTYDYHVADRRRELRKTEEVKGYQSQDYATERLWATARDGTRVPISIVYPKGYPRDGSGKLWLYGYGAYGYGLGSEFSSLRVSLLQRGVAFAIPHIRGGDELGESWHHDGMLLKKKNSFYDFIDCAEFLKEQKWTSTDGLVIEGASAGGLLMGAVLNLRPDLCRAALVGVPFVDVMNTMLDASLPLTTGEYLEWGNPEDKQYYEYMLSYSPYDNLKAADYPAMLVTTGLHDSQVMYWEPAKYVARLRTLRTDRRPLLLKTEMEAGHSGASGRYDRYRQEAFEMAWMLWQLGITK